ncbi:MAG: hypothetical protein J6X48_03350 [Lachnospiraceae bacterium]|nr:hypothetical protein [Lachnospiraceae bacterium]
MEVQVPVVEAKADLAIMERKKHLTKRNLSRQKGVKNKQKKYDVRYIIY